MSVNICKSLQNGEFACSIHIIHKYGEILTAYRTASDESRPSSIVKLSEDANVSPLHRLCVQWNSLGAMTDLPALNMIWRNNIVLQTSYQPSRAWRLSTKRSGPLLWKRAGSALTIEQLTVNIEDVVFSSSDFGAQRVYLFSRGLSEMIATEMEIVKPIYWNVPGEQYDPNIIRTISHRLNAQDVAIIISLNGHTEELWR